MDLPEQRDSFTDAVGADAQQHLIVGIGVSRALAPAGLDRPQLMLPLGKGAACQQVGADRLKLVIQRVDLLRQLREALFLGVAELRVGDQSRAPGIVDAQVRIGAAGADEPILGVDRQLRLFTQPPEPAGDPVFPLKLRGNSADVRLFEAEGEGLDFSQFHGVPPQKQKRTRSVPNQGSFRSSISCLSISRQDRRTDAAPDGRRRRRSFRFRQNRLL